MTRKSTTKARASARIQPAEPERGCPGFRFSGVAAGIKRTGRRDVAMLISDAPASAAAVFTQNRVKAAPVRLSLEHLRARQPMRGAVINSGNANACTGPAGMRDAKEMARLAAAGIGARARELLIASTGVIGDPLPMPEVRAGIAAAAAAARPEGFLDFADAILTTDKHAKLAARRVRLGGVEATLVGCTKGAGMIMPNMATTLTFVATDARVSQAQLRAATARAVQPTFNAIAVDGDTSTNDTLAVFAARSPAASATAAALFAEALTELLADLAGQLMADGEGVHHVVSIEVRRAATDAAARRVAQRVAISPLVKTAIAGADPNWGRLLCAVDPDKISLSIGGVPTVRRGAVRADWDEAKARASMLAPRYEILIDLGVGDARAAYLACDLSHDYVTINASYRS